MTDAPVVGSAAFELRAKREQMKRDLEEAKRDLSGFTNDAEREVGGSTGRIGGMLTKMGAVVAALSAVFAAGLAMAVQFGRASLEMADTIASGARRIGIGTEALQEYQYVARKTGEDAGAVSGALEAFSNKASQAMAGLSKESADAFRALGFEPADLKKFSDMEKLLDAVVDRIGDVSRESDRAAIAEKLGLGPLATALRDGSNEVARLRGEARDLGYVMDAELIRKGEIAQGKMEDLAQIIGIQMAEAFINLSDEVLTFTDSIAKALKALNGFTERYGQVRRAMQDEGVGEDQINPVSIAARATEAPWVKHLPWVRARRSRHIVGGPSATEDEPDFLRAMSPEDLARYFDAPTNTRPPRSPRSLTPVQPRGRVDRSEEREARRAERVEQEIYRLRSQVLGIADEEMQTVQQRYDTAQAQLKLEREAEQKELESRKARGDITANEFARLEGLNKQVAIQEDRIAKDILARDLADERLAQERLIGDLTRDLLSLQSGAARTAEERRRIELRLLDMAQDRARKELLNSPEFRKASKGDQDAAIAAQDEGFRLQIAATNRANMSPLDAWRDRSLKTIGEVDEAYGRIAANGLDALNDGLVDAIMGTRTLGEVFSSVSRQIIADLVSIGVRRGITEPLVNALFGGAKGGGASGWLGDIFKFAGNFKIPGFSSGVTNFSGGLAYVHQGELLTNLAPGTSVIPANVVNGMGRGGATYNISGNLLTPEFWAKIQGEVAAGEARVRSDVPGLAVNAVAEMQDRSHGQWL